MVEKFLAYKNYLLFSAYSAISPMCFSLVATIMIVYYIEKVHGIAGMILSAIAMQFIAIKISISIGIECTSLLVVYIVSLITDKKDVKCARGGDDTYENN
ncbi:hypothetical protein SAMN05444401_3012 [Clostridium amylolyticum]|uniref:Uncharacterized protein n=1 Tax=Clostridium amylolyticum TaxID=1121298 RepID=A0A1M6JAA1_9CLOT|nr:hypothetical protein [Clostridium amylolyticum]SHJ43580.1 hypothetical protein SAMN05444401_3012 [Clostridium amylolyticum]